MCVDINVSGNVVRGYIAKVLYDPNDRDVRVRLKTGTEGTIHRIVTKAQLEKETFTFYNVFFHAKHLLSIWNKETNRYFISPIKRPGGQPPEQTAFLFSDETLAKEFLQELQKPELALRRISRRKTVLENFDKETIVSFRLDEQRKVTKAKMKQLEAHFTRF